MFGGRVGGRLGGCLGACGGVLEAFLWCFGRFVWGNVLINLTY